MSTPLLRAGKQGERLPDGENVLRLVKKTTNDGKVSPDEFELSTQDKQSPLQSLSVWAGRLTVPEQARAFMGDRQESYSLFCSLAVNAVRALRPEPDAGIVRPLDVVWDPLTPPPEYRENGSLPTGADGHCGLTGLMRPPGLSKQHFFSLQSQLADLASGSLAGIHREPD